MSRPTTVDPALGFKSLYQLLHKHEPAVIAKAIKKCGIYTWDEFGDFVKAEDDGRRWSFQLVGNSKYKKVHADDIATASHHTQSFALEIVSLVYKVYGGKLKSPATQLVLIEGIRDFGWPKDSLPDFEAIQKDSTAAVSKSGEIANQCSSQQSAEQFDKEEPKPNVKKPKSASYIKPRNLNVIVDDINGSVRIVIGREKTDYKRADVTGRGTVIWDLLVCFAKHDGSLDGVRSPDVKAVNTSANRGNLNDKLMKAFNLVESPIVKNRAGVMRFGSITLAGGRTSPDALDRKTKSLDEVGTDLMASYGDEIPPFD